MKLDTKEKYDAWVLRKKHTKQPKTRPSDKYGKFSTRWETSDLYSIGRKANHHERYVDITHCFSSKYL